MPKQSDFPWLPNDNWQDLMPYGYPREHTAQTGPVASIAEESGGDGGAAPSPNFKLPDTASTPTRPSWPGSPPPQPPPYPPPPPPPPPPPDVKTPPPPPPPPPPDVQTPPPHERIPPGTTEEKITYHLPSGDVGDATNIPGSDYDWRHGDKQLPTPPAITPPISDTPFVTSGFDPEKETGTGGGPVSSTQPTGGLTGQGGNFNFAEQAPPTPSTDFVTSGVVDWDAPGSDSDWRPEGGSPTGDKTAHVLAEGGVVTKPTMATVGERGPEAVVPLGGGGARSPYGGSAGGARPATGGGGGMNLGTAASALGAIGGGIRGYERAKFPGQAQGPMAGRPMGQPQTQQQQQGGGPLQDYLRRHQAQKEQAQQVAQQRQQRTDAQGHMNQAMGGVDLSQPGGVFGGAPGGSLGPGGPPPGPPPQAQGRPMMGTMPQQAQGTPQLGQGQPAMGQPPPIPPQAQGIPQGGPPMGGPQGMGPQSSVVNQPTNMMLGESGPEMVVPLNQNQAQPRVSAANLQPRMQYNNPYQRG